MTAKAVWNFIKEKMVKLAWVSIAASILMMGCSGGDISKVKSGVMDFNKTTTLGQALDNWKSCEKKEWKSLTASNGVRTVEFHCTHKGVKEYFKNLNEIISKIEVNLFAALTGGGLGGSSKIVLEIDPKALDVIGYSQTLSFVLNKDDTFQLEEIQGTMTWADGQSYKIKYEDTQGTLFIAYKGYEWGLDELAPAVLLGALSPEADFENKLTPAGAEVMTIAVGTYKLDGKGISMQDAMIKQTVKKAKDINSDKTDQKNSTAFDNTAPPDILAQSQKTASIGPSFDCAKATHVTEKIVCNDKEIASLDMRVSTAYQDVRRMSKEPNRIRDEQLAWIKALRDCGDRACVFNSYKERVVELE